MLSKKLTVLIESFSVKELEQLHKFVNSPFHNENKELILLCEELFLFYKVDRNKDEALLKKDIWVKIYKGEYTDVKLRRLTSDMTRLIEKFIILQELNSQKELNRILLLGGLKNKNLEKHFYDVITKNRTLSIGNSTDYHFERLQTEILQHEFIDKHLPQSNNLDNLASADYHLDNYYIIKKLKFYCSLLSYKSVRRIGVEFPFSKQMIEEIKEHPSFNEAVVQVYYKTVLLLQGQDSEKVFEELRDLLILNEKSFPLKELQQIYFNMQNFCAGEINNGKNIYFEKLFDVYKIMIEREILPGEETLKPGIYKNIITLGLIIKEFDWTENFIQIYTEKLPKEHRENAKNYNLAKVYFHKQEYEKVIEQLREVEYKELVYALGGKLMLLKTYFELKEQRPMDSLIDSFRIYLRRNKLISKNVRQQYLNVLRFTKKLANIAPYDKKGVQKVKEQIEACKALADKKWLIDKVAELEK